MKSRHNWFVLAALGLALALPASVFADAPIASALTPTTLEDTAVPVVLSATDTEGDPQTFSIVSGPTHGLIGSVQAVDCSAVTTCTEQVTYTPTANYSGSDSFTYKSNDGTVDSNTATASITITSVNDAPVGTPNTVTTLEDHAYPFGTSDFGFTDLVDSPPNSLLAVEITTTPGTGTLKDNNSTVSATDVIPVADITGGKLVFTPAANANGAGYASFTFQVQDNGGTANSGVDLDPTPRTMTIDVTPVNDAPSFTKGGNPTVLEDSGASSISGWATAISGGPADESQTVTFTAVATDTSLFAVQPAVSSIGTLSYTPAANANGATTVTVTAHDPDGTANGGVDASSGQVFTITITPVNDAPSFTKGANQTILEDSGAQDVVGWATAISAGPPDESGQGLTFNVTNDTNAALFSVLPAIGSTGELTYTVTGSAPGSATITIDISDDGGTANSGLDTSATQTFTITVNPLVAHNDIATVGEGSPANPINVLANDNPPPNPQVPLTITGTGLASHGTVVITGGGTGLTYQPSPGFTGSDLFTYQISDGVSLTGSASVVITVGPDTTPPVASPPVETLRTGVSTGATVAVRIDWSATDAGVGVGRYLVQRSVDGGAYATITLPTALTSAVNQSLPPGHSYQYRMRAYDKNGNFSSLKYGPKFLVSRIENTNSRCVFAGGTWALVSNVNDSGGSARYTYTANATATMTLSGRDFAVVGPKNSFRGSAWVYVDGVFVASISEHTGSTTTLYRQVLWSMHFATAGTHTIQVRVASGRIDLDAFLALR